MKSRFFILVIFFMLFVSGCIPKSLMGIEYEFQKNTDIVRAKHLKYYGALIEEYKRKTGKYPFEGKIDLPIYIFIAIGQQLKYIKKHPMPISYKEISLDEFKKELEKGLNREIEIKYDPQNIPGFLPSFYVYMIQENIYYFAVHFFYDYPFTRKIAEHYSKVEVSNYSNYSRKIWLYNDLMNNKDFINLIKTPLEKENYFKWREEKYHEMEKSKK